jgi:hypothetical protein
MVKCLDPGCSKEAINQGYCQNCLNIRLNNTPSDFLIIGCFSAVITIFIFGCFITVTDFFKIILWSSIIYDDQFKLYFVITMSIMFIIVAMLIHKSEIIQYGDME